MSREDDREDMHRRKITRADGRYLIFYTFEHKGAPSVSASDNGEGAGEARREPEPVAEAEEERSV
jgi:hypothetical protein